MPNLETKYRLYLQDIWGIEPFINQKQHHLPLTKTPGFISMNTTESEEEEIKSPNDAWTLILDALMSHGKW